MSLKLSAALLHLAAASGMAYGFHSLEHTVLDKWIRSQVGGHLQYLTIQALAFAWITTMISLSCDLLPTYAVLRYVKRCLFMISLPLATVVSTIYWSLIIFAPSLILQPDPTHAEPSSKNVIPLPMETDLCLHALPAVSLLIDFFAFERSFSPREAREGAAIVSTLFAIWYSNWVEYCARQNGTFPYPFLNNPFPVRVVIYIVVTLLALFSFRGINSLHSKLYAASAKAANRKSQ